jgi:hypothetical protein
MDVPKLYEFLGFGAMACAGLCRFVATVPGIFGLAPSSLGAVLGPQLRISGRIQAKIRPGRPISGTVLGPFGSAKAWWATGSPEAPRRLPGPIGAEEEPVL